MKNNQSELLTQFYQAYLEWVKQGAPTDTYFSRYHGLCYNSVLWMRAIRQHGTSGLLTEIDQQFAKAGLSDVYPFDTAWSYSADAQGGTLHRNPKRMAWVHDHAT